MTHFQQLSPQLYTNQLEIPLNYKKYIVKTCAFCSSIDQSVAPAKRTGVGLVAAAPGKILNMVYHIHKHSWIMHLPIISDKNPGHLPLQDTELTRSTKLAN